MRIGIFGGTFDPIHETHVAIGRTAQEHANLDQVLFVVAADPPHKDLENITPAPLRLAMVEAALADESRLSASDIELRREGPSYTVHTVRALRALHPEAAFYLVVGEDSLADLPNWYQTEAILNEVNLLVLPRPDTIRAPAPILESHYEMLPFVESTLSSTQIRAAVNKGDTAPEGLHPSVYQIVTEKGLYHAHR